MNPFLAAQAHDPFDPAPLLIHADWLDEQGDQAGAARLRGLAEGGFPSVHALALAATLASAPYYADVFEADDGTKSGSGSGDKCQDRSESGCGDGDADGYRGRARILIPDGYDGPGIWAWVEALGGGHRDAFVWGEGWNSTADGVGDGSSDEYGMAGDADGVGDGDR